MDIVQNSIQAKALRIEILVYENLPANQFIIEIQDNGSGMDKETLQKVKDPFFTSRKVRKVGLGIPLLLQNAERTGGNLTLSSVPGHGTTVKAIFQHSHLDRPPLGDIADALGILAATNPLIHFIYTHTTPAGSYTFDTQEIRKTLAGTPLEHPEILSAIKELIRENLNFIQAGQTFLVKNNTNPPPLK